MIVLIDYIGSLWLDFSGCIGTSQPLQGDGGRARTDSWLILLEQTESQSSKEIYGLLVFDRGLMCTE